MREPSHRMSSATDPSASFTLSHPRFTILRQLGAGGMGVVFEALDHTRGTRVALKTLQFVDPASLLAFKQEFRALSALHHPGLVPLYELFADGAQWFFSMELVEGAVDFDTWATGGPTPAGAATDPTVAASGERVRPDLDATAAAPDPATGATLAATGSSSVSGVEATAVHVPASMRGRVQVAAARGVTPVRDFTRVRSAFVSLAEAVAAIHRAGKLHRDLKPGNVLVGADGRLRVLDFGLIVDLDDGPATTPQPSVGEGSERPRASATASHVSAIAGTVAYMSPEQASARPLGPASDWYAVGAMLFHVLTGRHAFDGSAQDVLRAKAHRDAPSPQSVCDGIPSDLGRLCADLLARDAEQRPSGAEVLSRLRVGLPEGTSSSSSAAPLDDALAGDAPFLGREAESARLHDAAAAARAGGTTVLLVTGRSGMGKSALVDRFVHDASEAAPWLVLEGRCYEQESLPYKAFDGIVDSLAAHLASLPSERRRALLPQDLVALPVIFPTLARLDEASPPAPGELDRKSLRDRAFTELAELFAALAAERPLLLHVDDVQWGDADSAELLSSLLSRPSLGRVLFLFAARAEHTGRSVCLAALAALRGPNPGGLRWHDVVVEPLAEADTARLADALLTRAGRSTPEAVAWIAAQSAGTALFVYELARHVASQEAWRPGDRREELDAILQRRVRALPATARAFVEALAVAGQPLALRHVEAAVGLGALPPDVIQRTRVERLVRGAGVGSDDDVETFHDRVRESVVAGLDAARRTELHRGLARALDGAAGVAPELVATHLEAGGDAARAAVYYRDAAERAVAVLAFDRAEALFQKAAALAVDREVRADVLEKLVHFYTDLARFAEAYEHGRKGAALFGASLPEKFAPPRLLASIAGIELRLLGKDVTTLAALPETRDEDTRRVVRIIAACAKAAYQLRPELCVTVSAQSVGLCLRHGLTPDSAICFMVYGAIFKGGVLGRHGVGHAWGKLALALVDRFANDAQRAEVNFVVGYFGTSWREPAVNAEALYRRAREAGLASRDSFHVGCATAGTLVSMMMRGAPLPDVIAFADDAIAQCERLRLDEPLLCARVARWIALSLVGGDAGPSPLDDPSVRAAVARFGSRHFVQHMHVGAARRAWLLGDPGAALAALTASEAFLADSPGMLHAAEHHFWIGMTHASLGARATGSARRKHLAAVTAAAKKFAAWSEGCPENFAAKARLLEGERDALRGRDADAAKARRDAREIARSLAHPDVEAMAAQALGDRAAAAEAYRRWGAEELARRIAG